MQATSWEPDSPEKSQLKYRPSLFKVAQHAIRTEGWRVMFAGLSPTLVRAVPVSHLDLSMH